MPPNIGYGTLSIKSLMDEGANELTNWSLIVNCNKVNKCLCEVLCTFVRCLKGVRLTSLTLHYNGFKWLFYVWGLTTWVQRRNCDISSRLTSPRNCFFSLAACNNFLPNSDFISESAFVFVLRLFCILRHSRLSSGRSIAKARCKRLSKTVSFDIP